MACWLLLLAGSGWDGDGVRVLGEAGLCDLLLQLASVRGCLWQWLGGAGSCCCSMQPTSRRAVGISGWRGWIDGIGGDEWLARLENRGRILDREGIPRWERSSGEEGQMS